MFELKLSQVQKITFVMISAANVEVSGLGGGGLVVEVSKNGAAFAAGAGVKAEIGNGWYSYTLTAGETDTIGPLSVKVTGAGALQQNLEYVVSTRAITAIEFTYTVTKPDLTPIEGVQVWITTDSAGVNVVWNGDTDTFGVARDDNAELPRLDPGTYFFFRNKSGYIFVDPDTEVVS
jgi:hypothetical protein